MCWSFDQNCERLGSPGGAGFWRIQMDTSYVHIVHTKRDIFVVNCCNRLCWSFDWTLLVVQLVGGFKTALDTACIICNLYICACTLRDVLVFVLVVNCRNRVSWSFDYSPQILSFHRLLAIYIKYYILLYIIYITYGQQPAQCIYYMRNHPLDRN